MSRSGVACATGADCVTPGWASASAADVVRPADCCSIGGCCRGGCPSDWGAGVDGESDRLWKVVPACDPNGVAEGLGAGEACRKMGKERLLKSIWSKRKSSMATLVWRV